MLLVSQARRESTPDVCSEYEYGSVACYTAWGRQWWRWRWHLSATGSWRASERMDSCRCSPRHFPPANAHTNADKETKVRGSVGVMDFSKNGRQAHPTPETVFGQRQVVSIFVVCSYKPTDQNWTKRRLNIWFPFIRRRQQSVSSCYD